MLAGFASTSHMLVLLQNECWRGCEFYNPSETSSLHHETQRNSSRMDRVNDKILFLCKMRGAPVTSHSAYSFKSVRSLPVP